MKQFKPMMVILVLCGIAFLEGYYLADFGVQLPAVVAVLALTTFLATCWMHKRSDA